MSTHLTPEEKILADRIAELLQIHAAETMERIAALLASKSNAEFFGRTEFVLRDMVHELGAKAIEIASEERKKRGTEGAASTVLTAIASPDSSVTKVAKRKRSSG